jgi:Starch-binding associating with outer membrane
MKMINKYILFYLVITLLNSCNDFNEIGPNNNKPISVPPSTVLRGVLSDINEQPWSLEHRQNQFWSCNYEYYGNNEYWDSYSLNYITLKNIVKMEEEAAVTGDEVNPYTALGKYLRAVLYVRMTQRVGDLPMDEALQGVELSKPTYNTQKEIYLQVLTWLDEANDELEQLIENADDISPTTGNTLQGDIFFSGNLAKWRKAVNTFKLRVLISLSKKDSDTDLDIQNRFAEVINDPTKFPIMTSNADNMNYVYNGTTELYPINPGNRGFDKGRYNMTETYVKGLTDLNDPRVYVVCNPASKKLKPVLEGGGGLTPTDFAAYVGAPAGEGLSDMTVKAGNGEYSFANQKRYYTTFTGPEPGVQLSYWELCFNIAEAINRGWTSGDANTFYQNGIKASMAFYGIVDGSVITITESDKDEAIGTATASVTDYLAQSTVVYDGNTPTGLTQILTQKYLAFFQNSGQEAYFNYRRTGLPTFHSGPGTGNSSTIPKRWLYPSSESFYNEANYTQALQRQFSGVDDLDEELWINQ